MAGGRPSKYKAEFCDRVVELGRAGKTMHQIAADIGVCIDTVNEWAREKPEFSSAKKTARDLCAAYWLGEYQKAMRRGDTKTAGMWIFYLKNIAGFRDNLDTTVSGKDGAPPVKIEGKTWLEIVEEETRANVGAGVGKK